jgi:NAD+ kinase
MYKATKFSVRKIGLVIKHDQPEAARLALIIGRFILSKGLSVVFAKESASVARSMAVSFESRKSKKPRIRIVTKEKLPSIVDLIVVFGGDGTYLSIARLVKEKGVPVMGVNMGRLGFLTEIKETEAREALEQIIEEKPTLTSERAVLDVSLKRNNKSIYRGLAVNDVVVSKGAIARIIGLEVSINGKPITLVRSDGVIVSTPTGSTAYSLAAGGPIVEPSVPAMTLTTICPHSLTLRPLVIPDTSEIEIKLNHRPGHVLLTIDGQDAVNMKEGDVVTVRRSKQHSLKLISSPTRDYFSLLHEKLKFGMRS